MVSEGFQRGLKPSLVLFVSTSVFGRACEKGIVMLPRGVSERVADNLFGCRAFGRRRHLEGMRQLLRGAVVFVLVIAAGATILESVPLSCDV